ncbi:9824_t:CDS:2, partial [Racocetra persica]
RNTLSTQAILLRANDYKSKSTQTTLIRPNENKLNRLNRIIFGNRIFDEPKDIERVLKEVLSEFQTSKDVRRQSTEMGVQIMKYRTAIRQFVKEVRDEKLEKCNRIALQSALNEGGREAVEKLLKVAFLEYSMNFMSDGDKQRFNSLKQLSDLSFPAEWHPAARTIQRKIILHVGPTNSGKTYNALKCLENANSGVYCGPLRLLAHEVFDRFNNKGVP